MSQGRYDAAARATIEVVDARGTREVRYLRRRIMPDPERAVPMAFHVVGQDDRLDLVASRYYGNPLAAWQIADANHVANPDELVGPARERSVVVIPVPGF